jgi:RNA polymerase sigma-70 factor (ECF subfamily)
MGEGLTSAELKEVHRRYGPFLRRRCLILLRERALADDAFQEVFMKLLRHGAPFRSAPHPMRWLHRVTDHACFDLLRTRRRSRLASPLDEAEDLVHPGVAPDVRHAVLDALSGLSDEDKQIAVLAFVDGMSQQEIADDVGYSRVTVNKRIAAIRERLVREKAAEEAR